LWWRVGTTPRQLPQGAGGPGFAEADLRQGPVVVFPQVGLLAAGVAIPIDVCSVVTPLSLRKTISGSAKQMPTDNALSMAVEDCNGGKGELFAYTCRTRRCAVRWVSFVLSRRDASRTLQQEGGAVVGLLRSPLPAASRYFGWLPASSWFTGRP